jgi:hypothetical protein
MTNENTKSLGTNLLTWTMIAGAALMFLEITVSSLTPVPAHTATAQTITIAHPDRVARN